MTGPQNYGSVPKRRVVHSVALAALAGFGFATDYVFPSPNGGEIIPRLFTSVAATVFSSSVRRQFPLQSLQRLRRGSDVWRKGGDPWTQAEKSVKH